MMKFECITKENLEIFLNLAQAYEAEFSSITGKNPGPDGRYELDTTIDNTHKGYLAFVNNIPVAFAVLGKIDGRMDIAEFFIIPTFRRKGVGKEFAFYLFDEYFGEWQVREIDGADHAKCFWKNIIAEYTNGQFIESHIQDNFWGAVTCQVFHSRG